MHYIFTILNFIYNPVGSCLGFLIYWYFVFYFFDFIFFSYADEQFSEFFLFIEGGQSDLFEHIAGLCDV